MIKKNKIPTILGILILFAGVFAGVILLKNSQLFKIGANPSITPKNVRISNISDSSATITWTTEDKTEDFISYGLDQALSNVINEDEGGNKYSTHSITITGLNPDSGYYFKINSGGTTFDNNGVPWLFSTGSNLSLAQNSIPVSGSVITASGEVVKRAIVYAVVNGYAISTLTSDGGTFVIQLGSARTSDLSAYAQIDAAKTLLEISVTTESGETATAKIFPRAADPIPPLIIGQDQDFRNLEPTLKGQNPDANLSLPETATRESKFSVSESAVAQSKSVTLESLDEGEVVASDKPEFFGNGPVGAEISISVQSENPISGTTKVTSKGSWKWSPPTNLSSGTHTVTISWIDASGIKRTLSRNFIVQAGELPAFVATPSATPTSTPSPTRSPTPAPTRSAAPTATPVITKSPTARPRATPTSTPAALPKSGSLTPTILLFIMGLGVIAFSLYTWKLTKD